MPWGLLPLGLPLGGLLVLASGALILPRPALQRVLAGTVVTLAGTVAAVVGLGTVGRLTGVLLLAVLAWATLAVLVLAHRRNVSWWRRRHRTKRRSSNRLYPRRRPPRTRNRVWCGRVRRGLR